jgi:hypothetical protein
MMQTATGEESQLQVGKQAQRRAPVCSGFFTLKEGLSKAGVPPPRVGSGLPLESPPAWESLRLPLPFSLVPWVGLSAHAQRIGENHIEPHCPLAHTQQGAYPIPCTMQSKRSHVSHISSDSLFL